MGGNTRSDAGEKARAAAADRQPSATAELLSHGGAPRLEEGGGVWLRSVAEEVRSAFPRPLRGPELVLIDVDPRHLHAFWTLLPSTMDAARAAVGIGQDSAPLVVRVASMDAEPAVVFDVEVAGLQGQCYIDVWDEPRRYVASLGIRRPDATLAVLTTSVPATLPAIGPAEKTAGRQAMPSHERTPGAEPQALTMLTPATQAAAPLSNDAPSGSDADIIEFPASAAERLLPTAMAPVSHPFALPPSQEGAFDPLALTTADALAAPKEGSQPAADTQATSETAVSASTAESDAAPELRKPSTQAVEALSPVADLAEPVEHPFPLPPVQSGDFDPFALTGVPEGQEAKGGQPAEGESGPSAVLQGAPSPAEPPELRKPSAMPPHAFLPVADQPEPVQHPFPLPPTESGDFDPFALTGVPGDSSGSTEADIGSGGASEEEVRSGESAPAAESGSGTAPGGEPNDGEGLPLENVLAVSSYAFGKEEVELEINAELHIFGRVRPGTSLRLFGRKVPLRPDGSFSVTRPLPNGAIVLSALAVNEDGEEGA